MTQPPPTPGWFPDPLRPNSLRYWDGTQWTDQVASTAASVGDATPAADAGATTEPIHTAASPPPSAPPPGPPPGATAAGPPPSAVAPTGPLPPAAPLGPPPGPPGPPPGPAPGEWWKDRRVVVTGVLLLLLIGLIAGVLAGGGDDDNDDDLAQIATTQAVGAGEIFLESAADAGPNPFTTPVAAPPPPVTVAPSTSVPFTVPTPQPTTTLPSGTAPPRAVPAVAGGTPGLYGGTRNNSSCDQRQMITFLTSNPSLGRAWAGVHGISVGEIPTYINGLTPLVLRADTRVTNHGFEGGIATPRQSVLEAGTAVLIDQYGVPRARCYCGNPLLEPRAVPYTPTYRGPRWPRFDPGSVVVINQNTTIIQTITIVDINTGLLFGRPIGTSGAQDGPAPGSPTTTTTTAPPTTAPAATAPPPTAPPATRPPATSPPATSPPATSVLTIPPDVQAGSGDLQFTVLWQSDADLDLHVIEPGGNEVSFENPSSPTGGNLDVDQVPGCGSGSGSTHVENVYWPTGAAPRGTYQVYVRNFDGCSGNGSFQLRITQRGRVVYDSGGSVPPGGDSNPVQITN